MPLVLSLSPYAFVLLCLMGISWVVKHRNNKQAILGFLVALGLIFFPSMILSLFFMLTNKTIPLTALTLSVGYGIFVYPGTYLYWP